MTLQSANAAADLQLAASLQEGKQESLAVVYDKYAPALGGIINRMVNEKALAEKILQDSFINAWRQVATFDPANSSFFTWLINITRQTAFAALQSHQNANSTGNNLVYDAPSNLASQETAFDLVYYKGLSYAAAAAALQATVAEVKTGIHLTLNKLKQQIVE